MNIHLIKKWLADLRSGTYQQSKSRLKGHFGYCCLGVLAEGNDRCRFEHSLLVIDGVPFGSISIPPEIGTDYGLGYLLTQTQLAVLQTRFGFTSDETLLQHLCMDLNDIQTFSFAQIADVLEFVYTEFMGINVKGEEG